MHFRLSHRPTLKPDKKAITLQGRPASVKLSGIHYKDAAQTLGLSGICFSGKPVMKREHVKARHAEGQISATHVIQNPADLGEWIVFFKKSGGRSYFLRTSRMRSSHSRAWMT